MEQRIETREPRVALTYRLVGPPPVPSGWRCSSNIPLPSSCLRQLFEDKTLSAPPTKRASRAAEWRI